MGEVLLPLLAGLLAGVAVFVAMGRRRRARAVASAGVETLAGLRWRDFAHLVLEALRREGYVEVEIERQPGDGGFDFVLARDGERYLLSCKQGHGSQLGRQAVIDFATEVRMHGARGGIIATLGSSEGFSREVAASHRVEVLEGTALWTRVSPLLGSDVPRPLEATWPSHTLPQRLTMSLGVTVLSALVAYYAMGAGGADDSTAPQGVTAIAPPPPPARASATPPTPTPPHPTLSEEQEVAHRRAALQQIGELPAVAMATWSSRSTLVIAQSEPGSSELATASIVEACRILLQFEELRFTRLQVEPPPGSAKPVRWRQCR